MKEDYVTSEVTVLATRKQIKDSVIETTQQSAAQIGSLVNDLINITIHEIGDPAWAFREEKHHSWSWLKRKTSFTATSEDTVLERDVDKIALMRQKDTPQKLIYVPDEIFYREIPDPTETGNPTFYRLWEVNGLSTKLAEADKINIVSSSSSDSSEFTVVVMGYVSGRLETETYSLNGTTTVEGSTTFDAREIFISKSANTNGTLTVTEDSGGTTLVTISKDEISPRFKIVSLWPIPTNSTIYLEYYKRIKELNSDSECPEFDPKWHHVVRVGTLAKVYEHLGKTADAERTNNWYAKLVRSMVASDRTNQDSIQELKKHDPTMKSGVRLHISEDVIA